MEILGIRIGRTLRSLIANTGWLLALKVLRILFAFFVGVWVARYMGPAGYGAFNYAFALVMLFSPVTKLGLESVVVQDLVRERDRPGEILGTTFLLRLVGGIVSMAGVVVFVAALRPGDAEARSLAAVMAFGMIFTAFDAIDLWFQARVESKYAVYAKSAALVLANLAKVYLIVSRAPLIAFAWITALEIIAAGAGLAVVYRARGFDVRAWLVRAARVKALLAESWPMMLASVFAVINLKIDQVMLGQLAGEREVGIYATAVRISEVWYFVPGVIAQSAFPVLIESRRLGAALFGWRMQQLYDLLAWLAIGAAAVVTVVARPLVELLFGPPFADAAAILTIHVWAGIFVFLREAVGRWFIMEDLLIFSFITNGLGAAVNVALNLVLIPRYGGVGAAIATVISYASAGYLACFVHPRTRRAAAMMTLALVYPVRLLAGRGKRGPGGA